MVLLKKISFITVFVLGLSIFLMACSNGGNVDENSPVDEKSVDVEYGEYAGNEIHPIEEGIDIYNLSDGTYPIQIFFEEMKRNKDSLSLDAMVYTVIHYDPEEIRNLKQGDIIYEYVDETTTENYLIDTVNFPLDEVCVINGGSERGEGLTLTWDAESGYFIVSVNEVYTRHASHGVATLEIPDSVPFEDNHNLEEAKYKGDKLYEYFSGLGAEEKEYFNENNTFVTVVDGQVIKFYRIYLP